MGGSLVLESLALLHWCERNGFGPLGLTGVSMGGHMASLAASNWHKPIALVPCLSWSTASGVFTKGVMSSAIDWELLEDQFFTDHIYREEIQKMLNPVEDDAFRAGQHFAKHYPSSMESIEGLKTACDWPQSTPTVRGLTEGLDNGSDNGSAQTYLGSKVTQEKGRQSPVVIQVGSAQVSNFQQQLQRLLGASRVLDTFTHSKSRLPDGSENQPGRCRDEALQFMCGIMDECTHIRNFSTPVDPSLIIVVTAKQDGYVPREGVADLRDLWPGIQLRYVDTGHIAAFLLHQSSFRNAIADAFQSMVRKYWGGSAEES